jgi:hypothetical protein
MGCFSYICPFCGKGVQSSSFDGQHCHIYFLDKGKVVEEMTGAYDSYGRVFQDGGTHKMLSEPIEEHDNWETDGESIEWKYAKWGTLVEMSFGDDIKTGFAIVHTKCKPNNYTPTKRSENDPNQGWGENYD